MKEFVQSCLSDIGADHKVWVAEKDVLGLDNELDIFVSHKSSVKPSIFDKKVWIMEGVPTNSLAQYRLRTEVENKKVYISFLKKGISVFDLAGVIQEALRNVDGYVVIPPDSHPVYDDNPF